MPVTRRILLRGSALTVFGGGALPAWLARAASEPARKQRVLVTVFLRGAADALNIVIPFKERQYAALRPTIAVPEPKGAGAETGIDLDGFFSLHPALSPILPLFRSGELAVVHATGSPDPTRSHFDAQDYMESGTPGRKSTPDGWMNRALRPEQKASPLRAVSATGQLARALRGKHSAIAIGNLRDFQLRGPGSASAFEKVYLQSQDPALRSVASDAVEAMKIIRSLESAPAGNRQPSYPRGQLGRSLQTIAQLIRSGAGLELAFAEQGGWDHHANETGPNPMAGQLANQLRELGGALSAFHSDLGEHSTRVTVVCMSEFGRTVRENGTRGTDHGHGSLMFVLGGGVNGGKIYGRWPGLEPGQLFEGRDLAVTTDFRTVLTAALTAHSGLRPAADVFPGFQPPAGPPMNLWG